MRSWLWPVGSVLCLWVLAGLTCLPALATRQVRDRIERWPTSRLGLNYVGLVGLLVVIQIGLYLGRAFVEGPISGQPLLRWTALMAVGYPICVWALIALVGSATGRWDRSEPGVDGRLVLGGIALLYAVATGGLAALVVFLLFVAYFPG